MKTIAITFSWFAVMESPSLKDYTMKQALNPSGNYKIGRLEKKIQCPAAF